jgi:hypothetical protein
MAGLWEYRPFRARWALRWRTRDHVQEVAADLAADAASYMVRQLIPADALAATLRHAFLDEIAEGIRLSGKPPADDLYYGVAPKVGRMLGWLALHRPHMAGAAISEIIGDAEDRLGVPRHVTEETIRTALDLDGNMDNYLDDFLARVLPPGADSPAPAQ